MKFEEAFRIPTKIYHTLKNLDKPNLRVTLLIPSFGFELPKYIHLNTRLFKY